MLSTHIPPGLASEGYNISVAVFVRDILGSMAVTTLGKEGWPSTIVSVPPEEVIDGRRYWGFTVCPDLFCLLMDA